MTNYIDLSYPITDDIAVYPGDEGLKLSCHRFFNEDGYNDTKLETGMHVGTHIDAPSHLTKQKVLICDYPIDKFIGNGCLLDVRGESVIDMNQEYLHQVQEEDIVLLYTGYDEFFGTEDYFKNHPIIDEKLAQFFVNRKIKLVGMDLPSPDQYPYKVHQLLLENDVLIIENLRNLESLLEIKRFEVIAIPLNIEAEGSLTRVVAKVY